MSTIHSLYPSPSCCVPDTFLNSWPDSHRSLLGPSCAEIPPDPFTVQLMMVTPRRVANGPHLCQPTSRPGLLSPSGWLLACTLIARLLPGPASWKQPHSGGPDGEGGQASSLWLPGPQEISTIYKSATIPRREGPQHSGGQMGRRPCLRSSLPGCAGNTLERSKARENTLVLHKAEHKLTFSGNTSGISFNKKHTFMEKDWASDSLGAQVCLGGAPWGRQTGHHSLQW